jgi:protein ERP2
MFSRFNFNIVILFLITLISSLHAFDIELTVLIPANQRECFHQVLETGKTVEIEYEVLAGGDIDINYWFYSPSNRVLQSDFKKRDGHQTLKLEETGEYRFCFDNSLSRFNQKQVYFSVRLINEQGHNEYDRVTESWMKDVDRDDLGDLQSKIQEFKVSCVYMKYYTIDFSCLIM